MLLLHRIHLAVLALELVMLAGIRGVRVLQPLRARIAGDPVRPERAGPVVRGGAGGLGPVGALGRRSVRHGDEAAGARAAGGVILVTTKRPKGETTFQLNYNNNFAFASAMNLPEQAPLTEYLKAYSDAAGDQFWTMGSPSVTKWLGYLEQYRNNPSSIPTVGDGIYKDADGGYILYE